jgi:hypothetical protein
MFGREAHAVIVGIPPQLGYGALFALIFTESAGVPVPGESALIAAGLLAGAGHMAQASRLPAPRSSRESCARGGDGGRGSLR